MRDGGPLATLLRYELLQVLRDRRTILIAVVAPVVLYPLLIFLMRWTQERQEEALERTTYEYAITGPAERFARRTVEEAFALPSDSGAAGSRFAERETEAPDSLLGAGELHLVLEGLDRDAYRAWLAEEDTAADPDTVPAVPALVLRYRVNSDLSREAHDRLEDLLGRLRMAQRERLFLERGFPVAPERMVPMEGENLASAQEEGGVLLARFLTPLLVMLMLGGGTVVGADAISGEKERGTLETLLTTAATRSEIVWAKLLTIVSVGVAVTLVNLFNLLFYLVVGVIELPEGFAVRLPPETLLLLLALYLPVALLMAAILLLISGYARSYKEYQLFALPLSFLFLIPASAAFLPGIDLRSAVAAVPLAGVSVAVREILTGEYDWAFLGVAFASTTAAAVGAVRVTSRFLSTERLLSTQALEVADLEGGAALFPRHVLRWFGGMWVALLLLSLWFGQRLGIRGQVAVNLLGLFLGGSLFLIWRYRLPLKETLSLRAPHPAAWLAVAVGAPSAYLTGVGVARLADRVFPVPREMLESFGQYLLPEGIPLWQIVVMLCVLPGVCEEIAFRGVLLHGLRKKLGPWGLALAVGAIFGLFHVDLFRIVPTAYLGAILAGVVLLSGSIYPAMLWHALNNGAALVPSYLGMESFQAPWSLIGLGAAGLAVAFWILWRTRRPGAAEERGPP